MRFSSSVPFGLQGKHGLGPVEQRIKLETGPRDGDVLEIDQIARHADAVPNNHRGNSRKRSSCHPEL